MIEHYASTILTLFIVSCFGYMANKRVKTSSDFSVGGRSLNSFQVSGSLISTIIGGASTIGTAQLAFNKGINSMWFTLGASIACIFLAMLMAGPLRKAEVDTVSEFLGRHYGVRVGIIASILTSFAIFIHIIGQTLSSAAILTSMFNIRETMAVIITILLIISYIIFGGFWGASTVGILKTFLLYSTLLFSGLLVINKFKGFYGFINSFPKEPWFNLFSGGILEGLAQGFSMVVGICSTQIYLQAMFAGKDGKTSRNGALISAFLIPPVGFICTLIGMFMKIHHPSIYAEQALPTFILTYLNPWFGGIMIATLIISVVGTGAGLTLGISTMISRDIYRSIIHPNANDNKQLKVLRLSVICVSFSAMIMVFLNMDSLILEWGFLSMALRGTVIFIPLMFAVYFKEKINKRAGLTSMVAAPSMTILWSMYKIGNVEPLYVGLTTSLLIFIGFYLYGLVMKKIAKEKVS